MGGSAVLPLKIRGVTWPTFAPENSNGLGGQGGGGAHKAKNHRPVARETVEVVQ